MTEMLLAEDNDMSVRGSVSSPLSLSVLMSPFWQKAHRMLQEVKKIVPQLYPSVGHFEHAFRT
jgi:hypothetical protein